MNSNSLTIKQQKQFICQVLFKLQRKKLRLYIEIYAATVQEQKNIYFSPNAKTIWQVNITELQFLNN